MLGKSSYVYFEFYVYNNDTIWIVPTISIDGAFSYTLVVYETYFQLGIFISYNVTS